MKLDIANPRTGKPKVRQITRDKEEWHPIEIPRIVSDEQHKKALLQARKNLMFAKRCTKQTYLLQGLIRCGKDNLMYRGHQEKSGVIYYYCKSRATNTPQENCNSPYLRADQIEPMVWNTVKSILENPEEVFNTFRDESILNEERAKSIEGRLDYIDGAIEKLEVAKKRITEAFKAEAMTLPEFRKEKTDLELSEEKLLSERDALKMKLNVQHDVGAKIDLFKETCHKFLSKINDPKIVTERVKKDIIKLVIDRVVIEGESVKIFAMIPLPTKIHERELVKADIPGTFNTGATLGPINETNMARIWNKHKQTNTPLKKKVFVGLSGGVDSSVSAALLKKAGYEVTGVFIRVWSLDSARDKQPFTECTTKDDRLDAMRVCATLGIPFMELNLEKEYKKEVVDYMIREYRAGRTPNPDVACNRFIKFGGFYTWAMAHGADFIATGHYARVEKRKLRAGSDRNKDQSYFLWQVRREQLPHILFPVGGMKKPEVRKLAKQFGLVTADKKDSQGLCFVGKVDMKDFLSHYITQKKGKVLDEQGEEIGEHDGSAFYTIGERLAGGYVVAKDLEKNTIVIAQKNTAGVLAQAKNEVTIIGCNWVSGEPQDGKKYFARTRYRAPLIPCQIFNRHPMSIKNMATTARVVFATPQTVAPGQSLVLYFPRAASRGAGDVMLGGGVII